MAVVGFMALYSVYSIVCDRTMVALLVSLQDDGCKVRVP